MADIYNGPIVGQDALLAVKEWAEGKLAAKADSTDLETKLAEYAKKSDIVNVYKWQGSCTWAELIAKTDAVVGDVYSVTDKGGMNYGCITAGTAGADSWDALGSITEVDLSGYAEKTHTHEIADVTGLQSALDAKADASDVYTKAESDASLALKADAADVYTKSETYTKTETDALFPAEMTKAEALAILNS